MNQDGMVMAVLDRKSFIRWAPCNTCIIKDFFDYDDEMKALKT